MSVHPFQTVNATKFVKNGENYLGNAPTSQCIVGAASDDVIRIPALAMVWTNQRASLCHVIAEQKGHESSNDQ